MNTIYHWISQHASSLLPWFAGGSITSLIGFFTGNRWEKKKLSRAERSVAYSHFLDLISRQGSNHKKRDQSTRKEAEWSPENSSAKESRSDTEWISANGKIQETRDELYATYAQIEILGSRDATYAAHALIKAFDRHQAGYFNKDRVRLGVDERARLIGEFVTTARKDLGHRGRLDTSRM